MRLVDADKLRHELIMGHDLVGAKYTDMADTVEAIPIEWIKNKIAVCMHLWEEGKDKMFIENGVVEVVSYSLTAQALSKLLDWWEEEK